ncbi:Cu(+) exporting ATPase protein [Dioscorea alata]|uniref:Cu(+) exporting ATPase protein n=1 Tax=Dioscorea alata TaxID=55571 RepID=A0ACB7VVT7_DIOAL|nr:Cu(+) exporting ATPase protein [Dioscorea alata]
MASALRDLQLTAVSGGLRRPTEPITARDGADDLEDVRLLDSFDNEHRGDDADKLKTIQVKVTGMTCSACSNSVESAIAGVHGVHAATVSLLQNKAHVVFDTLLVKAEDVKNAIEDAGFEAEVLQDSNKTPSKSQKTLFGQFRIGGMTCAACVNSVEGILRKLPGVKGAVVALATSLGEVEYDPSVTNKDEIVNAIEDAGFEATFLESSEQNKVLFGIEGLINDKDLDVLRDILKNIKGLKQFELRGILSEVEVIFDPEVISLRFIVDAIQRESNGKLKANVRNPCTCAAPNDVEAAKMFRLFIASLLLSIPVFLTRLPFLKWFTLRRLGPFLMNDLLKCLLVGIVQFGVGGRFYVAAYRALRNRSTNMDVLVALGTSASYFYSVYALLYGALTGFWSPVYFETSSMLITFVLLGKYLEVLVKGKTSDAIKKLVELAPATALLLVKDAEGKDSVEREIDAMLIQPGDILKVLPGAKIPSDGIVVWGASYADESMVTGESVPVPKGLSSSVIGDNLSG